MRCDVGGVHKQKKKNEIHYLFHLSHWNKMKRENYLKEKFTGEKTPENPIFIVIEMNV